MQAFGIEVDMPVTDMTFLVLFQNLTSARGREVGIIARSSPRAGHPLGWPASQLCLVHLVAVCCLLQPWNPSKHAGMDAEELSAWVASAAQAPWSVLAWLL